MDSGSSSIGLVLSGGGSRAAYQVGSLRALGDLYPDLRPTVVVGTSMGAINGIMLAAGLRHGLAQSATLLEEIWRERTFATTFDGSISRAFIRAIQVAILRYRSPGPYASSVSIFDPIRLRLELDRLIEAQGGIRPEALAPGLNAVAVMTTLEGMTRKPLLLTCTRSELPAEALDGATFDQLSVERLHASHGLASAALPCVLPAVDLDVESRQVRLVDGGICDNHPVDPGVRLGAETVILIDSSGRRWWSDHYGTPHDLHPEWEIRAREATYCRCPADLLACISGRALGPLLRDSVGRSTRTLIRALGPTWPIYRLLSHKMGQELAYEVMSYVALDPQFTEALIACGYEETLALLSERGVIDSKQNRVSNPECSEAFGAGSESL